MKLARVLVLFVALAAGGIAAYLAKFSDVPAPAPPIPVSTAKTETVDVLVANSDISIGRSLSQQDVRWQMWPAEALSPHFIRRSQQSDAITSLAGSIARTSFSTGEPIREEKLIKANGSGYMAAVLPPGMRAISTSISPETGAGGFILPNDRVDVLLIRAQKAGSAEVYSSETILSNVRVLAIDQTVEEKNSQRVVVGKIATLALSARDTETLALATRLGTIALALRSLADADEINRKLDTRETVNVVRFGQSDLTLK